jgi:hypothetical protein
LWIIIILAITQNCPKKKSIQPKVTLIENKGKQKRKRKRKAKRKKIRKANMKKEKMKKMAIFYV